MKFSAILPSNPSGKLAPLVERHVKQARGISLWGYLFVGLLILPAIAWLIFAPLASAVVASGVVKVDLNRALVQHMEGGTVRVVHVRDGQIVKKGDPLIELGDVSVKADQSRLQQRMLAEQAGEARLEAEASKRSMLSFPAALVTAGKTDPVLQEQMAKEQSLFKARLISLDSSVELFNRQRETIQREKESVRASIRSSEESIAIGSRELDLNRRLAKEGLVSDTQVLQLEVRISDNRGRIAQGNAELTRADQRIGEIDLRINGMQNDYRQQASDQLKVALIRIQEIEQELRKANDASGRQIIKAPVDGEVIGLRFNSPGAVLTPRDSVAEIVPSNPRLIVEAQIQTQDINRVRKGQDADLRFTAFTYRTTDMAKGTVSYVGGDRLIQRENGVPYFLVNIDVDAQSLKDAIHGEVDPKLHAGMPVEVYLQGRERTTMQYLLEPLTQLMRRAAREL